MPDCPAPDDPLFQTTWVHVFEEDTADAEVYRPESDDIPLSRRPRRRLTLMPDGSARIGMPGPDDRPSEVDATWEPQGEEIVVSPSAGKALRVTRESARRIVVRS
jgi:hypothetical protein